jgi:hypothetical protein
VEEGDDGGGRMENGFYYAVLKWLRVAGRGLLAGARWLHNDIQGYLVIFSSHLQLPMV